MKLKAKYNIKGSVYKIQYVDHIESEDRELVGECNPDNHTISIKRLDDEELDMATFLHEIIHAIIYESGLRQTSLSPDAEEVVAENVSRWLAKHFTFTHKRVNHG